ncbi:MAG: fibronectin type III domain-containing protein [Gemmatimonadetes bacterium]|nr:fibronectin type III domain-containing protein [Gemmatimonadota bacterium]
MADGTSQIDLAWSAPDYDGGDDIGGYLIEESRDGGEMWTELVANTGSTSTAYSHTGLAPATTVRYRVAAINSEGAGDYSNVADAKTDATVPDAPTDLQAEADGTSQIDLAWDAPEYDGGAAVSGYLIEESRWRELVANTGSTSTAYSHTGLAPATTVHYRVSAINEVGAGDHSNEAGATTDATVPDPPTDLQAEANGTSQIDLAWDAPEYDGGAAVSGYRIEVSEEGDMWTELVANTGSTSTAHTHDNLPPATTRHYRVFALNEVGASLPSDTAAATTDPDFADPPTGLSAEANGPYEIELSWTEPVYTGGVPVTGYRIEVLARGGEWTELVDDTRSTSTSHRHERLRPASTRSYRVSAINAAGVGDPSEVATATTDPVVPDAPTALTVEADGTSRLLLSWTVPEYDGGAEITGYRIEVSANAGESWRELVANTNTTRTGYAHEDLRPATTRHYRISAINEAGVGTASEPGFATTDATVPDAPTGLAAAADGPYQIQLAWEVPPFDGGAPISGYRVEVSEDGGSSWQDLAANTGSTETSYEHADLDPAATRHYRVSGINEIGTGEPSEVASATTDAIPPDPPTGLTATAVSPTQIDLAWVAPEYDGGAEITGYMIEFSADSADSWAVLEASTGSTLTEYSHTNLPPGSTRFYRVSAINVAGTGEPSNVASASTDDPVGRAGRVNEAILPHFAAASTTSALDAIGARIEAVADRNPLMGQLKAAGLASLVGRAGRDGALSSRLIDGMSFSMPLGSGGDTEGLGVATWGSAEYTLMSDEENEEFTWDGGMLSLHLGVDVRVDRDFLVGVSAGRSSGTYDFTDLTGVEEVSGTYEARMNSLYPYVAWLPGRTGVAVWGVSGFGWGEVVVDDSIAGRRIGTARSMTGALAGSRILAASGGSKLRVRTEGWASRVKVDGDAQMDSLTIDMQRGRLALEWSQGRSFGGGDEVTFMLEGGARFGSGDGTDGVGMEVGGGLRYNNAVAGLTLEGRGRLLSAGSGYQEIGFRGLLQVDPQGSEGLSVKVVPALGDAASAVDELWDRGVGQLVHGGSALARRVDARMEYGFAAFHGTPYSRIRVVEGGSQSIGTGVRYDLAELLEVQLEGTRNQGKLGPARHAVSLRGQLVF